MNAKIKNKPQPLTAHIANMKNFTYVILILSIATIAGCNYRNNKIQISGKIIGSNDSMMTLISPLSGTYFIGNERNIRIDTLGTFHSHIISGKIGQVSLFCNGKAIRLFLKPGDKINLLIKQLGNNFTFTFTGTNSDGQDYINKLNRQCEFDSWDDISDSEAYQLLDKSNLNKIKEIQGLKELYNSKKIDRIFYEYTLEEIDYFYALMTVNIANSVDSSKVKNFSGTIGKLWIETFEKYPVLCNNGFETQWWYEYADNYITYKEMHLSKNYPSQLERFTICSQYLSKQYLEYYKSMSLFKIASARCDEKLLESYEDYKNEYPKSVYLPFVSKVINPIQSFYEKIKTKTIDSSIFVKDYMKINSLEEVVRKFKGRNLFVDVWATWCGPCREELKHSKELKLLLSKYDYELLHISMDFPEQDDLWKDMIKFYDLSGKQLRANDKLFSNLVNLYSNNDSYSIPWHMIFDSNGNMIIKKAYGSLQLDSLERQLMKN